MTAASGDSAADSVVFVYDNTAPIVDAGANATLMSAAFLQNASVSDSHSVSFAWSVDAGPGSVIAANVEDPTMSVTADGSYTIRLTATDVAGNSAFDTFTLDWDATAPSLSAGSDKLVAIPTLQNATATDLNPVNYSWVKLSGPGNLTFSPTAIVEDPTISADADGEYVIQVTATDSYGNASTDTINFEWDTLAPTVNEVRISNSNGAYGPATTLDVLVIFSEEVDVSGGTPEITMEVGAVDDVAPYLAGTGTDTLTFRYTVKGGDNNNDFEYVATNSLAFNGATIQDQMSNPAVLTLVTPGTPNSISDDQAIIVDTTAPSVSEIKSSTGDGTYGVLTNIDVQVVFDEPVVVSGIPDITLETGVTDRVATYFIGSGTDTLFFNYQVQSGDYNLDLDYVATNSLNTNGGSIVDLASNTAALVLPSPGAINSISDNQTISVDTAAPNVAQVTADKTDGSYGIGEVIPIRVIFNENVTVSGTPEITLETGTTDAVVSYSTGTGTQTLTFNYTVAATHMNADLDYQATNSLALNGGTITDGTNNAVLTLAAPGALGSISDNQAIDVDTAGPTVNLVRSTKLDGNYPLGEVIDVLIEWSEAVDVTGLPEITLETGGTDTAVSYFQGTGTTTLTFRYTVAAGNINADLDYVGTNSLNLNGGTINSVLAVPAILDLPTPGALNSISDDQNIGVDGVNPTVTQVRSSKADGFYNSSEVIDVLVEFDELITVSGTPQITLETGATDAVVNYLAGSGTGTLTFQYTVGPGDNSNDLDYVSTSSLVLNGGSLTDPVGNNANLVLATPGAVNSISDNQAIVIDTITPSVSSVSSTNTDGAYNTGSVIGVRVVFDEAVVVTGSPQISLELGATDQPAIYSSGSGTDSLTFNYTVGAGDTTSDLDYTNVSALVLNSGTIDDQAGNASALGLSLPGTLNSISDDQAIVIDTTAPTLGQVLTLKPDGSYGVGEVIDILVEFDEPIIVTGLPVLTLETGTLDTGVVYSSGSGSNLLTFAYTVASGNLNTDLDYTSPSALNLSGGTLKDVAGNDAPIALPVPGAVNSISDDKAINIDGTVPSITEVKSDKPDGGYRAGEVINVQVVFDEVVTVSGIPEITLETGTTDAVVPYSGGTGTDTLTFQYTVAAGQLNADLDYVATNSINLNGGSIGDSIPNPATLTMATPGALNSISDNQAILVDAIPPVVDAGTDVFASASYTQNATVTDDTAVTYSWTQTSGAGIISFDNNAIEDPTISATLDGAYTIQLEVTDAGGNTVADTINFDWDTMAPPALDNFFGATTIGIENAAIDITVDLPLVTTDYNQVVIRGLEGATPPADCDSGTIIKTYNVGEFIDETYLQNTNKPGIPFSARVCIRDSAGNTTGVQTFSNIIASKQHKIFTSSALYTGDLDAGYANSTVGADDRCQSLADTAGITGAVDKWVGVISVNLMSARSKVAVNGPIKNMNGDLIANNKFDLWDGTIANPILYDEDTTNVGAQDQWSGTLSGGNVAADNCDNFKDGTTGFSGRKGIANAATAQWVSMSANQCNQSKSLICVSQYDIAPVDVVNINTGGGSQEIDYDFDLPTNSDVPDFYQKIEVYRKTSAGPPTLNCDGSDGSVLAHTFNGPFTEGQNLVFTDFTPGVPGTVYNFTVCLYDNDSNVVDRYPVIGVSSGL